MKIAYIAHPVSGDVQGNIKKILDIVRNINLKHSDVVPFVPYLADLMALNDDVPEERFRGIKNDHAILRSGIVNELWLYGPILSNGMRHEVLTADSQRIPIIAMDPEMKFPEDDIDYDYMIKKGF